MTTKNIFTNINKIESVILDKDGTIIDVHHYWIGMSRLRIQSILNEPAIPSNEHSLVSDILERSFGINSTANKISRNGPAGVKPRIFMMSLVQKELKKLGIHFKLNQIEILFREVDIISEKKIDSLVKILPGVEEFIENAKSRDMDLNLVSNDITPRAELALKSLGLLDSFRFIFGQDKVNNPKPSGDLANLVLNKGSYDPNATVNIGDHPNDMRMGLSAGIKNNYAVLTGLNKEYNFKSIKCECIDNLQEFIFS